MKIFLLLATASLLSGCCETLPIIGKTTATPMTNSPVSGVELHKAKLTVDIDPELLRTCSLLPVPAVPKNPLPSQVLDAKIVESSIYFECAARHAKLSKIVRDALITP